MTRLVLTGAAVALALGLAACGYDEEANYADNGYNAAGANEAYGTEGNASGYAAGGWPEGARIVVEEGVTYRIDPGGARIALGPNDARIVVEEGTRFRVDPDGTRVRIDEQGAVIRVDGDVDADVRVDNTVTVNRE